MQSTDAAYSQLPAACQNQQAEICGGCMMFQVVLTFTIIYIQEHSPKRVNPAFGHMSLNT